MMETGLETEAAKASASAAAHSLELGFIESFDRRYPTRVLETLLRDRTTGHNIIWADNEYEALGEGYMGDDEITVEKITGMNSGVIKPRIAKEQEKQSQRTKSRAEVFTPSWLCNQMNNDLDEEWFGRRDVFNVEQPQSWKSTGEPIEFPKHKKGHGWHSYVESPRLEITCGEAPFVCSRYDTVTGDALPVGERIGFLDRKLRVVSEKTQTRKEWVRRALDALKASYGFEYQGDNLLIARINVLETFCEHLRDQWGAGPSLEEIDKAAWIVSWNFWQMNGFTDAVPSANKVDATVQSTLFDFEEPELEPIQPSLFDLFEDEATCDFNDEEPKETVPLCVIYDWKNSEPFEFASLKGKAANMGKKFYAAIGNPPYQAEPELGSTRALPIYDTFMDEAYRVSDRVELVTPARFLFGSGQTNSAWNKKMLADRHLEVVHYEPVSSNMFPNVDIKGGVAVTYRDTTRDHDPIGLFIPSDILRAIVKKVDANSVESLADIAGTQCNYNFSELYKDHPDYKQYISGEGRHSQLKSNSLERVPIFTDVKVSSDDIRILGLVARNRVYRFCPRKYIDQSNKSLMKYKVVVPASNGSGAFGEVLSRPTVEEPGTGFTQTFMCIGAFNARIEADAALKYIKTKFSRTLLAVLKTTQHNPPTVWRMIPLQDFTPNSDIDWSKPIADIDRQLYAKYGLDENEIEFIESHVKEME